MKKNKQQGLSADELISAVNNMQKDGPVTHKHIFKDVKSLLYILRKPLLHELNCNCEKCRQLRLELNEKV